MENGHLQDDKLYRAVHDRLSDYEAPSNGADWDAMSRSLDALPKSSRFQWKISLNSILVLVGVVGISALGFALATHSAAPRTEMKNEATVKQNTPPVNTTVSNNSFSPVATNLPTTNAVVNSNTQPENGIAETNSLTNPDGSVKIKKRNNKLLFGDQIDPRKGFIYNTKENGSVITQPITDPNPNVFYDSENGTIKKIEIKKDSSGTKTIIKTHNSADSTKPVAPTDVERQGFDIGG